MLLPFDEQLLSKIYELLIKCNKLLKRNSLVLMNEKLARVTHERWQMKQWYLNNMRCFENDPNDGRKRVAEKALVWWKLLVSHIRKILKKPGDWYPAVPV